MTKPYVPLSYRPLPPGRVRVWRGEQLWWVDTWNPFPGSIHHDDGFYFQGFRTFEEAIAFAQTV